MNRFDSIILGDNPFQGVDHLDYERGRNRMQEQENFQKVLDVLQYVHSQGINKMVLGSSPKLKSLIEYIKKNSNILEEIEIYPLIPNAQEYVLDIEKKGLMNTIKDIMNSQKITSGLKILTKGGLGFLKKDPFSLFQILVDLELSRYKDLNVKTVFLHETITDLALSLDMKKLFETFQDHLAKNYSFEAGIVTKNFSRLVTKIGEWDLKIPYIMTSFNKSGFQMNPSRIDCEKTLSNYNGQIIVMSPLAGGFIELEEAYDYLNAIPQIKNIVFGISSIKHAKQVCELFLK